MTIADLARYASAGQMIPHAGVEASRSVRIVASVNQVWRILTDVSEWERWHPYLKNAQLAGQFDVGSKLTYGGAVKHQLCIAMMSVGEQAVLYGTMLGYKGVTRWETRQVAPDEVEVTFTESSAGFLLAAFYSTKKLGVHLEQWLYALKKEAEARSSAV